MVSRTNKSLIGDLPIMHPSVSGSSASPFSSDGSMEIDIARPVMETIARDLTGGADRVVVRGHVALTVDGPRLLVADRQLGPGASDLHIAFVTRQAAPPKPEERLWTLRVEASGALIPLGCRVHRVRIVGAGFYRTEFAEQREANRHTQQWSRLIGALGSDVHARLVDTRCVVVGCGRTGSLLATTLARHGVRDIALIDPDLVELHNLDAMDGVSYADVGRHKAHAVADSLRILGCPYPRPVASSVGSGQAIDALRRADFVLCCADDAVARMMTTALATLYLKPLLDVGTGVQRTGDVLERAADIRLILPGEARCLHCFGGIAQGDQLTRTLGATAAIEAWDARRSGSLRSLNQVAAHLGIGLLEDLAAERVLESTWLRLEYAGPLPAMEALTPPHATECPICALAGQGDHGLPKLAHATRSGARRTLRSQPPGDGR